MSFVTMGQSATISDVISVFKPRIAASITLSAIGGIAVAQGSSPGLWRLTLLAVAVFLAAGSAGAFNQWVESDLDARMERTANRPFVTGKFIPGTIWLAFIIAVLIAAVLLAGFATNWWAALYTFFGSFHLWNCLHNVAQAPLLDQYHHWRACGKLCGSGGCCCD